MIKTLTYILKPYYYFLYLAYKAFTKLFPKVTPKWAVTRVMFVDATFKMILLFILLSYGAPQMYKYLDENDTVRMLFFILILIFEVLLFKNTDKWLNRFSEFDKLPHKTNKSFGLIILGIYGIIALTVMVIVIYRFVE